MPPPYLPHRQSSLPRWIRRRLASIGMFALSVASALSFMLIWLLMIMQALRWTAIKRLVGLFLPM